MPSKEKIRILFIHHGSGYGGAPISLLNLILKLNPQKYEFKILFIRKCEIINKYKQNNLNVETLNSKEKYFKHHEKAKIPFYLFFKYFKIYRSWNIVAKSSAKKYLKQVKPDIVHLNSDVLSSWAYACKQLGIKVVCHNRDPIAKGYLGVRRFILRKILNENVDHFISISEDNRKRLGIPNKTSIVYNFIPIPETYKRPFQDLKKIKILYMGGLRKAKGFKLAVDCLDYLPNNTILLFAGNMKLHKSRGKGFILQIKKLARWFLDYRNRILLRKINNNSNSVIIGHTTKPLRLIDSCDVLINPFTIPHFSRPVMEALAYGKPVVASNIPGMDEIVDHNKCGLLFSELSGEGLANSIGELISIPQRAIEFGQIGREKAISKFAPDDNVAKVEHIYDQLVR